MSLSWGDGPLPSVDLTEIPPVETSQRQKILDLIRLSTDDTPEGVAAEDAAWQETDATGQLAWQRAVIAITARATEMRARARGFPFTGEAVRAIALSLATDLGAVPASSYAFWQGFSVLRFRWLDGTFLCWEGVGDSRTGFWRQAVHADTEENRTKGLAEEPRWIALPEDEDATPVDELDLVALPCYLHGQAISLCKCPIMREVLRATSARTLSGPACPDGAALHEQLSAPIGPQPAVLEETLRVAGLPLVARTPEEATHAGAYHGRRPELRDAPAPEWERADPDVPGPSPAPTAAGTTSADWMKKNADALPVTFLVACTNDGTCRASFNVSMKPEEPDTSWRAEVTIRPCPDCKRAGRDGGLLIPRLPDDPGLGDTPAWGRLMATRGIVRGSRADHRGVPCMVCQADALTDEKPMDIVVLSRHGVEWIADLDCTISVGILEGGLSEDRRTVLAKDSTELCATCSQPFTKGVARIILGPEHGPHYPTHERTLDCTAAQEAARLRAARAEREREDGKAETRDDWTKAKPHVLKARADKRHWRCALCKLEVAPGIEVAMKLDRKIAHGHCQKKEAALLEKERAEKQEVTS